jgi:predicted DNA-binding mobile mystery protein A
MPKFAGKLRRKQLDEALRRFRDLPKLPRGYIREIREALEMSSHQMAGRLHISQPSVLEMEANERAGKITLNTLERAARALGCQLVYALVPDESLESNILAQAQSQAKALVQPILRTMALEQQSTNAADQSDLIQEMAEDILRKGGRQLWRDHAR